MRLSVNAAAAAVLAASLVVSYAQSSGTTPPAKKHAATKKEKMPPPPSVADQINALRQEFQGQIDSLKSDLAAKDVQLKQAQQTAADAQAKADKAEADAMAQQQAVAQNQAAVTTLESTVTDVKANTVNLVGTIQDVQAHEIKRTELSDLAFGKVKIGATFFADWSYWSDWDGSTAFIDQTTPTSVNDQNFNTFEVSRSYINLYYTPKDAATLRITPDIYRNTDGSLALRLKYGYVDLNKLFAGVDSISKVKVTFGVTQNPVVPWEEDLNAHRYTYKIPLDFSAGMSSSYAGVHVHGPVVIDGKTYLDTDLGVYTNGKYSTPELASGKQFMGRLTYYPMGTKVDQTGLGVTIFGDYGETNKNSSSAASGQYEQDRTVFLAHYQTSDKAYMINFQYDLFHNIAGSSAGPTSQGFAFEGNARLGGKKSPFQLWGLYQYYEPYSDTSKNQATMYERTVGGIAYKYNSNLTLALGDSNLHYLNPTAAAAQSTPVVDDANALSVWSQFSF
jgi:Skp family chaperone for outer membrane proteins